MTKADWLDFFEAINGRSATEEEIAAALAAGEFQDDAPAQGAPAQPAFANVQEAPVQGVPAQPGFAAAQETPAQEAQPQPAFAGTQEAPVQGAPAQPGFASAQATPGQAVPNQAFQPQAGFANAQAGQQAAFANGQPLQPGQNVQFINGQAVVVPAQPSAFGTTFKNYWTWLLNAWRRPADMTDYGKHIFRDPATTFLNSFDRFGRLTSLALPVLLVTILLGAIGLVVFPGFLFYVVYFLFALANLFTIVPVTTAWKADKFYQMILAALLNGVILSILFAIVFTIMSSFTVGLLF